jgi:hypothetical protein
MEDQIKQLPDEILLQGIENAQEEILGMLDALKLLLDEAKARGLKVDVQFTTEATECKKN